MVSILLSATMHIHRRRASFRYIIYKHLLAYFSLVIVGRARNFGSSESQAAYTHTHVHFIARLVYKHAAFI